jgi:pimeloyl-ACP methyl ester carboxylesterase
MQAILDRAPGGDAGKALLAMLPPAKASAQDLVDQGFVAALRASGFPMDVLALDARADDYLEGDIAARLEAAIFGRGYARLWLMGISLGGWGCLSLARKRPGAVASIVLLAPFLGSRDPEPLEAGLPPVYLGFGDADRYAEPSRMLARRLPAERVVVLPGAHDWPTWMLLWHALLARLPFGVSA